MSVNPEVPLAGAGGKSEEAVHLLKSLSPPGVQTTSIPITVVDEGQLKLAAGITDSKNVLTETLSMVVDSIKKRSSSSQKRNYRQAAGGEDGSEDEDEPVSASSKLGDVEMDSATNSGDLVGHELESHGTDKSENEVTVEICTDGVVKNMETEAGQAGPSSQIQTESTEHGIPLESPQSTPGIDENNLLDSNVESPESDLDGMNIEPPSPSIGGMSPGGYSGYEIEDEDMSSTSSSDLELMEDEGLDDDSSDSSDSLFDLEPNNEEAIRRSETATKKTQTEKKKQELPKVLQKPKPKSTWSGPREVMLREIGYKGKAQGQSAEIFRSKFYGSLFSVERLELMRKLDGHTGCVNCLHFNYAGTKLISGSDDLHIKIWNYSLGKLLTSFHSKHKANVFQAKFMPLMGLDNIIVSCARDFQVRLTELDSTGEISSSRKLAQHRGPAHKLTVSPETPHVVLTCGEDGSVFSIDIREEKPQRLFTLKDKGKKVPLYSIHNNPLVSHEFCTSGRDEYIRIYDTRRLSRSSTTGTGDSQNSESAAENDENGPVKRFCPHHLQGSSNSPHVTAAVYNYNGREIVGSYNDENIYLFDATHSDLADCTKVYEGHRNSATVKGVNFFGDRSQYVVSGSDCGHVFIWDKQTESIVNFFRGDENGVVNCLEPHPSAPILATSGLDDDVKIWIPSSETAPKMGDLAPTVRKNLRKRMQDLEQQPDALDGHIMWQLINHLNRQHRSRRRDAGLETDSDSDDTLSSENEDEDGPGGNRNGRGMECAIS